LFLGGGGGIRTKNLLIVSQNFSFILAAVAEAAANDSL
jgi:hypothetical protein